jgi:hypothetical protein
LKRFSPSFNLKHALKEKYSENKQSLKTIHAGFSYLIRGTSEIQNKKHETTGSGISAKSANCPLKGIQKTESDEIFRHGKNENLQIRFVLTCCAKTTTRNVNYR